MEAYQDAFIASQLAGGYDNENIRTDARSTGLKDPWGRPLYASRDGAIFAAVAMTNHEDVVGNHSYLAHVGGLGGSLGAYEGTGTRKSSL